MGKRKSKLPPFVAIARTTIMSKDWRELKPTERITYIQIKYHFNGSNNGQIKASIKTLAKETNLNASTVCSAIKTLMVKGWIERTNPGGLYKNASTYRLTGKIDSWGIFANTKKDSKDTGEVFIKTGQAEAVNEPDKPVF